MQQNLSPKGVKLSIRNFRECWEITSKIFGVFNIDII